MTTCLCDLQVHPKPPRIDAGLSAIPRQTATFAEFRRAMLSAIGGKPALSRWEPGSEGDLGTMLVEMWAYLSDSLSFYEETLAHEAYLRTARLRPTVRRLAGLLGYIPRPAVAATVDLALVAEGRKPITLPVGTAFRSGAFGDEAPQVFEITASSTVHPLTSRWALIAPRPSTLGTGSPSTLLLFPDTASVEAGQMVLVVTGDAATTAVAIVGTVSDHTGADGEAYVQAVFDQQLPLDSETPTATLRMLRPQQTGGLNLKGKAAVRSSGGTVQVQRITLRLFAETSRPLGAIGPGGPDNSIGGNSITLNGLYRQIRPGEYIVLADGDDRRWFRVRENREVEVEAAGGGSYQVGSDTVNVPKVYAPATQLVLDADVNDSLRRAWGTASWASDTNAAGRVTLHYGMARAGTITVERTTRVGTGAPLSLAAPVEEPEGFPAPERLLLEDHNTDGWASNGSVDFAGRLVTLDSGTDLGKGLLTPAHVFANVVTAHRGETVRDEVLGNGDASMAGQSFTLKKAPLTYRSSPKSDGGLASTLEVWVNGIRWTEVPSFYGQPPDAQVFIVRQDDERASMVTFGDGVRGARLPSGTSNVTATYRHGAGAAAPPAGSITQMAKPVKGVTEVRNPVAAHGGDDAESEEGIRTYAPTSALILGRAVSLQDMEAVAAREAGVKAVKAGWMWHPRRQRPVADIRYIGEAGIEETVAAAVRGVSDPSTPIVVEAATSVPLHLVLDVLVTSTYVVDDVLQTVHSALLGPQTGLLSPERIGIGAPLFRSRLFEAVLAVDGVEAIRGARYRVEAAVVANAAATPGRLMRYEPVPTYRIQASLLTLSAGLLRPFESSMLTPGEGAYFDLAADSLSVNRSEVSNG